MTDAALATEPARFRDQTIAFWTRLFAKSSN